MRERGRESEEIEHSNETGRVTSALNEFNDSINCNCQIGPKTDRFITILTKLQRTLVHEIV